MNVEEIITELERRRESFLKIAERHASAGTSFSEGYAEYMNGKADQVQEVIHLLRRELLP